MRALDERLAQKLAETGLRTVPPEDVVVGHTGTEEPERRGSSWILRNHRVEARSELGMHLVGRQAAEPLQLLALLGGDPRNLVVGRRRSDDGHSVDEVRPACRQSQRDSPARAPACDPRRLREQALEHGGEVVCGGCDRRPLSGGDRMRPAVPRAVDRDQPHVPRPGRRRVGVEAAGARGAVAEHDDALFCASLRREPGSSRGRSVNGDAAA
jgi:hypothetical protein